MRKLSYMLGILLTTMIFSGCPQMMVQQIEKLLPPPGYKPRYMTSSVPMDTLAKRYDDAVRSGKVDTTRMYDETLVSQALQIDSILKRIERGQEVTLPPGVSADSLLSLRNSYAKFLPRKKSGSASSKLDSTLELELNAPVAVQMRSLDDKQYPLQIAIRATVTDSTGRVILGLAPPYLKNAALVQRYWTALYDSCKGINSRIDSFSVREIRENTNEPYALAFVIDHSGSMGKMRIRKLREAVRSTMNIVRKGDMLCVIPFAGSAAVDVPLSADSATFKRMYSLDSHARIRGGTSIYDAVEVAAKELAKAPSGYRKVVLLFTDGEDTGSKRTLSEAVRMSRDSGVAVYAVAYGLTNEAPLETLTRLSNGRFYRIYSTREFPYMFADIYNSLKSYYLITYQPPPCNGIHNVNFELSLPELGVKRLVGRASYDKSLFSELDTVGSITFLNLEFESAKYSISDSAVKQLEQIADDLKAHPNVVVEIRGHTDDVGSPESNQRLSENRSSAVADALVRLGVPRKQLKTAGFGSQRPLVPNSSPENRAKNRRTEFVILAN